MKRSTVILLIVFAALLVLLLAFPRIQNALVTPTNTPTPYSQRFFNFENSDVIAIKVIPQDGQAFEVRRDSDGSWTIPVISSPIDTEAIDSAVTQFVATTVLSMVGEVEDLSVFGLSYPVSFSLTIELKGDSDYQLELGAESPTGKGYYALLSDNSVVVLSKYSLDQFLNLRTDLPILEPTQDTEVPGS